MNVNLFNSPWAVELIGGTLSGVLVGILLSWLNTISRTKNPQQKPIVRLIKMGSYAIIALLSVVGFIWSIPFLLIAFVLSTLFYTVLTLAGNPGCIYTPQCKDYLIEAIEIHGLLQGSLMGYKRIMRCNPWSKGGHDPVPPKKQKHAPSE